MHKNNIWTFIKYQNYVILCKYKWMFVFCSEYPIEYKHIQWFIIWCMFKIRSCRCETLMCSLCILRRTWQQKYSELILERKNLQNENIDFVCECIWFDGLACRAFYVHTTQSNSSHTDTCGMCVCCLLNLWKKKKRQEQQQQQQQRFVLFCLFFFYYYFHSFT